jgi:hypothetical protein
VTELWFSVRQVVVSRQMRQLPEEVAQEFFMREWEKVSGDRYELETKDDMKERLNQSPDLADWLAIAVEGARRLGFPIEKMSEAGAEEEDQYWLEKEVEAHRKQQRKRELSYA